MLILRETETIGRNRVGPRGQFFRAGIRNAHRDGALICVQRGGRELREAPSSPVACRGVFLCLAESLGHYLGNLVFEAFTGSIRIREVVGVRANSQYSG